MENKEPKSETPTEVKEKKVSKTFQIIELHKSGKTIEEIVAEGFNIGTAKIQIKKYENEKKKTEGGSNI